MFDRSAITLGVLPPWTRPVLWIALAGVGAWAGQQVTRAVLGPPSPPGPPGDERAPGEPIPPGLGGEEPADATWEDRYFPFMGFAPEVRPPGELLISGPPATVSPPGIVGMVAIPEGEATIGDGRVSGARPPRRVVTKAFSIDRTEVTCRDYQRFLRATGKPGPTLPEPWAALYVWHGDAFPEGQADHPVVLVTRAEAAEYCAFVGARLPTEVEWERAARGDDGRAYPWGELWDSTRANVASRRLGAFHAIADWRGFVASYRSQRAETWPVGVSTDESPFGVRDMAGNVSEWVSDTFAPYPGASVRERRGFDEGLAVTRGNAWGNRDYSAPMANRYPRPADHRDPTIGFRCAK